ncbi:MAG TPA: hypothetical protein VM686_34410, partial [Polyangiaceae bacterium]|nr:hypothetical protein [Polyangiaceae bacterium]
EVNRVDGLEIQKDGAKVDPVLIETAMPVDAGAHVLSASAPGRKSWRQEIELTEGASVEVEVPVLENDVAPPPAVIEPAPVPAPVQQRPRPAEVPTRPVPTSVYVLGGVAVVGAAAATVFGLDARAKKSDAEKTCSPFCTEQTIDDANRSALFCDVSLGIALVSAATGATLFFTRPTVYVTHDAAWLQVDASF